MSLINAIVNGPKAVVAADTWFVDLTVDEPAVVGHTAKLFVLPHLHTVLVGRGSAGLLQEIFTALCVNGYPSDLADVGEQFGAHLREQFQTFQQDLADGGMAGGFLSNLNAMLVGWSAKYAQTIAFHYLPNDGVWGEGSARGTFAAPSASLETPDVPEPEIVSAINTMKTPEPGEALKLARLQRSFLTEEECRRYGVGGHLSIAEITRDGINVRLVRDAFAEPAGQTQAPPSLSERMQRERDAKRARKAKRRSRAA